MTILFIMETVGPLGFTLPIQDLSECQEVNLTPQEVSAWCHVLPVADLGTTTRKIYQVLCDCNKVKLTPTTRFAIMELLHTHVRTLTRSLSKHFTHQIQKLSRQQLMIAELAQTLRQEMVNGYKLVIEEGMIQEGSEIKNNILEIALERIIKYNIGIVFQNYQLYSIPPKNTWKELHLSYKLSKKYNLPSTNPSVNDYKRALLLAAADPYQWNQGEQKAYFKATKIWKTLVKLRDDLPKDSHSGLFLIDLNEDIPPTFPSRNLVKLSPSSLVLDVNPILERLKSVLTTLEPNELKARITHNHQPEYGVTVSMLKGLIKDWESPINRLNDRTERQEQVKICVGLIATHYYLNNQKPFQSQQTNDSNQSEMSSLPSLTVQEENENTNASEPAAEDIFSNPLETNTSTLYPLYTCNLINENSVGYGLQWPDNTFPPIQAGEVIAVQRIKDSMNHWEICKIHWLQHQNPGELRMGVERLSSTYKVGAAETVEEGKPSGYKLRCLLLESSLLVPTLPFKAKSKILFTQQEEDISLQIDLLDIIDATGSYQRFSFNPKQLAKTFATNSFDSTIITDENNETETTQQTLPEHNEELLEGFESIWKNL